MKIGVDGSRLTASLLASPPPSRGSINKGVPVPLLTLALPVRQNAALETNNIHELFCNALVR